MFSTKKSTRIIIVTTITIAIVLSIILLSAEFKVFQNEETTFEAEVERLFKSVKDKASIIRELNTTENVEIKVVDSDFFMTKTEENVDDDPLVQIRGTLYKALLMVSDDFSLIQKKVEQSGIILAATSGTTLYVNTDYFDPFEEPAKRTLAHEYAHILQFLNLKKPNINSLDWNIAWTAFIEGEADLLADLFIHDNLLNESDIRSPTDLRKPSNTKAGWTLDKLFQFPYEYGENFIYKIYLRYGWNGVTEAYRQLPKSSAQILHPEKYFTGFTPLDINTPRPVQIEWDTYYTDTLGEYFLRTLLIQEISLERVLDTSSHWVGDNSTIYINKDKYLVYWNIALDNEESTTNLDEVMIDFFKKMDGIKNGDFWEFGQKFLTSKKSKTSLLLIGSSDKEILERAIKNLEDVTS